MNDLSKHMQKRLDDWRKNRLKAQCQKKEYGDEDIERKQNQIWQEQNQNNLRYYE